MPHGPRPNRAVERQEFRRICESLGSGPFPCSTGNAKQNRKSPVKPRDRGRNDSALAPVANCRKKIFSSAGTAPPQAARRDALETRMSFGGYKTRVYNYSHKYYIFAKDQRNRICMDTQGHEMPASPCSEVNSPPMPSIKSHMEITALCSVTHNDTRHFVANAVSAERPPCDVQPNHSVRALSAFDFSDMELERWKPSDSNSQSEKRRRTTLLFMELQVFFGRNSISYAKMCRRIKHQH